MDSEQLEQLIQTVTEEILLHLGGSTGAVSAADFLDIACPECNERCAQLCVHKTQRVVEAGAARISAGAGVSSVDAGIAHLIDHTLLKPDATRDQIRTLCEEATRFGFASVCVNPWNVAQAAELVRGSAVKVCTVVGFPLGATLPQVKIYETDESIKLGAQEIDMVVNIGALKSGLDDVVEADIRGVVDASHRGGAICKVILGNGAADYRRKNSRVARCQKCRRRFREDFDRLFVGRRDRRRRELDARGCWRRHRHKGCGRRAQSRRREENGGGGSDAHRRERERQNPRAGARSCGSAGCRAAFGILNEIFTRTEFEWTPSS